MRCLAEDDARWSAWLDAELPDELRAEIEDHLETCSACREIDASLRSVAVALSDLAPELEPDPGFLVRFRARRDEISVAPFWTWKQFALRLLPIAAAVLIAALWTVTLSAPEEHGMPERNVLELEALGSPAAFAAEGPSEPVLTIALEPFPLDLP
jgi:anti-sigma factor RsiW